MGGCKIDSHSLRATTIDFLHTHSPKTGHTNYFVAIEDCHNMPIMVTGDLNIDIFRSENAAFLHFMGDVWRLSYDT